MTSYKDRIGKIGKIGKITRCTTGGYLPYFVEFNNSFYNVIMAREELKKLSEDEAIAYAI